MEDFRDGGDKKAVASAEAETSPSFQPCRAGDGGTGQRQGKPRMFLLQQFLGRMRGVKEGSWGKRFWQPGTVDFHTEASPTGNCAKPEGLPGFWGQEGMCQGYPAGEGTQGTQGEGSSGLTRALNFER